MLIHHTDCGMQTFADDEFRRQIQDETGIKPEWPAESFEDVEEDVRQSIGRITASPFIPRRTTFEVSSTRSRPGVCARCSRSPGLQ
jgi:carbonic anhydrase